MANCGDPYTNVCRQDVPYPQVSPESVPSLIDNLVSALYGDITKSVSGGRVVWNIPCDPSSNPTQFNNFPRYAGEGLLCYIMRFFAANYANSFLQWNFTGNGATAVYDLPNAYVPFVSSYLVYINGSVRIPTNQFTIAPITGGYRLTLTSNVPIGESLTVISIGSASGLTGASGFTGSTGPIGSTGFQGSTGPQGSTGFQGATGSGATGFSGSTGPRGSTGFSGSTGPQGATGLRGSTGLQGATGSGATGPQGATGLGATGFQGATGLQGATGSGATGPQGATGSASPAGGIRWAYAGNGTTVDFNVTGAISTLPTAFLVAINGIVQDPNNYTITGTTLTMLTAPPSGTTIVIVSLNGVIGLTGSTGITGFTGATGATGVRGLDESLAEWRYSTNNNTSQNPTSGYFRLNITSWGSTPTELAINDIAFSPAVDFGSYLENTLQSNAVIKLIAIADSTIYKILLINSVLPAEVGYEKFVVTQLGSNGLNPPDGTIFSATFLSAGRQGATGFVGGTGFVGATGIAGQFGSTGLTGSTGLVGATGLRGSTGFSGATGVRGTSSDLGSWKYSTNNDTSTNPTSGYFRISNSAWTSPTTSIAVNDTSFIPAINYGAYLESYLGVNNLIKIEKKNDFSTFKVLRVTSVAPFEAGFERIFVQELASNGIQPNLDDEFAIAVSGVGMPPTNFGNVWSHIGNGTLQTFNIAGASSLLSAAYLVTINGIVQKTTNYTIDNVLPRTITLSIPVPNGTELNIVSLSVA